MAVPNNSKAEKKLTPAEELAKSRKERNEGFKDTVTGKNKACLLYTSPSPRDRTRSRMPSSA